MKPIEAVLIGAGHRARHAYGWYALQYPQNLRFVAVAATRSAHQPGERSRHTIAIRQAG